MKFEAKFPQSNFLVILAQSIETLQDRMVARGTDSTQTIEKRMHNAKSEIETLITNINTFKFRIINQDLEMSKQTVQLLISALYSEELEISEE